MNVVAVPIIESNTELQGTRHSSMTARGVGGTTNRNSLSARQANGAAMLVEVDAAAVAVLLLVRLIAEGREVVAQTREFRLLKGIAEGTYNTKHAEAARLYYTTSHIHTHIHLQSLSSDTLMNVVAIPIV